VNTAITAGSPAKRRSLFDIGDDLTALNDLLEEIGGDVTDPQVCDAVEGWFRLLAEEQATKLDNLHGYIRSLEAEQHACERERDEWAKRAESRRKRVDGMRAMLVGHLLRHGGKAESASGIKFRSQQNGGKTPLVVEDGFSTTDERFFTLVQKIDNNAIRAAIEAGEHVSGARLAERGHHLRVS
jgi:hypothetical protein